MPRVVWHHEKRSAWGLIIFVQTMMFREIVLLGKRISRERMAPEQNGLQWCAAE